MAKKEIQMVKKGGGGRIYLLLADFLTAKPLNKNQVTEYTSFNSLHDNHTKNTQSCKGLKYKMQNLPA